MRLILDSNVRREPPEPPKLLFGKKSQCIGKEKHLTKTSARETKNRLKKCYGKHMVVYCCPHCGYYHVGAYKSGGKYGSDLS